MASGPTQQEDAIDQAFCGIVRSLRARACPGVREPIRLAPFHDIAFGRPSTRPRDSFAGQVLGHSRIGVRLASLIGALRPSCRLPWPRSGACWPRSTGCSSRRAAWRISWPGCGSSWHRWWRRSGPRRGPVRCSTWTTRGGAKTGRTATCGCRPRTDRRPRDCTPIARAAPVRWHETSWATLLACSAPTSTPPTTSTRDPNSTVRRICCAMPTTWARPHG